MVLKFQDYTKQRLEEDVRLFQNYYKFRQSNTYGLNDELDAFRMAYISSYIAYKYGDKVAKKQFESNLKMDSEYNNETLKEASMKIWNARVGREIAKDLKKSIKGKNLNDNQIKSMLAYSISEKLYDGKMVTSLNENKNYDDFDEVYFEKQEVEKIKPSANKPLEGKIEQNIPKDENKETDNSNTNNQYEYIETPCVGSYEVSGYTKKDGTEVEDYIRTCGAKHIRKVKKKGGDDNDYMDKNIIPANQNITSVHNNLDYKQIKNPDGSYKFEMRTSELSREKLNNKNTNSNNIILSTPWNTPYNITTDNSIFEIQKLLSEINNNTNKNNKNAQLLMNISIYSPKYYKNSKAFKYLNYKNIKDISKKIKIDIKEQLDGVYFDEKSNLSQSIINSDEFINEIKKEKLNNFRNKKVQISFNKNEDLFRGLHNVTIYNLHTDKNGYTKGLIYDKFDFDFLLKEMFTKHDFTTLANNIAYLLQEENIIKKYYIFIQFKIKI